MFLIAMASFAPMAAAQAEPQAAYDPALVVRIEVSGDPVYTRPHAISIRAQEPRFSRSAAEQDARVWVATREWDGGSQNITSTDCPAVRTVAISVSDLPPVRIAPRTLEIMSSDSLPTPPTIKDGFGTSLSFHTLTEDGSRGEVTIRRGNAYQIWGHDAVASLIPCWGPLTP